MTGLQAVFALILALTIALPANSCGKEKVSDKSNSEAATKDRRVPEGKWGGPHVRLEVLAERAEFEFDCAHGRLKGPLLLQNGRFAVTGTYVRERGPVRLDEAEQGQRVFFKGEVEGSRMTLTLSFAEDGSEAETFTLTHGAEARLFKCK
jgi:hypothetical protein